MISVGLHFEKIQLKKSHYLLSKLRYAPPPFNCRKGDCEIEENWLTKGRNLTTGYCDSVFAI